MSRWNHVVCEHCYFLLRPGREPTRARNQPSQPCCYCGDCTSDGIYYRAEPTEPQFCNAGQNHEDD